MIVKALIPYLKVGLCLPIILFGIHSQAQNTQVKSDTLTINLQQAEKIFIDSNFILLASHYNVDAQKALIEQAKVWQNPTLNTDQVIAANGKFFPYGHDNAGNYTGQYYVQVQQLIQLARKRGKLIDIASTNAKMSELQLQDLLRTLRYQLHQDYFNIQQQLSLLNIYNGQYFQLNRLLTGMQAQLNAGNIAQKDLIRIQALVIALQQDRTDLNKSIADNQADIKTLLQIKDPKVFVKPAEALTENLVTAQTLESVIDTALVTNPAYLLQQMTITYQQQNLTYQKALRVPDLTLGPNFDRNSNFAPNYWGLGISLPLPVWNNNKGNIKAAEFNVKQQAAVTQNAETELRNNVSNAYKKLVLTVEQNNTVQKDFYAKYQTVYNNMLQSYQDRQISLLEFLDFFNDFTDSQQRLLQQQLNLQLANEELKYQVGK